MIESRQLTAEEHEAVFRLRTILQSWGVAADEIAIEELLSGLHSRLGEYQILDLGGDFSVSIGFQYVVLHHKSLRACDAWHSGEMWSRYGESVVIYNPDLMPPIWQETQSRKPDAHVAE